MVLNITVHTLPLFVKGGKGNLFIASCVCAVMNIRCTSKQSYWLRVLIRYCTPKNGDFKIHITLYSVKCSSTPQIGLLALSTKKGKMLAEQPFQ